MRLLKWWFSPSRFDGWIVALLIIGFFVARRAWPALLLVHSAGCYGLQIDGTWFSDVIVIRVRA